MSLEAGRVSSYDYWMLPWLRFTLRRRAKGIVDDEGGPKEKWQREGDCLSGRNKPDRAKMRPDCVLACIDYSDRHVRYMEGQISRSKPVCRSIDSV